MKIIPETNKSHPVRIVIIAVMIMAVMVLFSVLAGCVLKRQIDLADIEHEGTSLQPTTLPDSDSTTDALFAAVAGTEFILPMQQGDVSLDTGELLPGTTRLHSSLFTVPNRVLKLRIGEGYRVLIGEIDAAGNQTRTPVFGQVLWYAYRNARWIFILERTDGREISETEASSLVVTLLDPNTVQQVGDGLWRVSPVWGGAGSYADMFSLTGDERISSPIPLADSGLGVLFGGDEETAAWTFRAAAFRLTDDGIQPSSNEILQQLEEAERLHAQSLYLPRTEDTWVVLILDATADPEQLTLTGGTLQVDEDHRLSGLFNMTLRLDWDENENCFLQMTSYNGDTYRLGQNCLGALLHAADVERVRCDPRFELTAVLLAADKNGVLKRTNTLWNHVQPGGDTPRGFTELVPEADDGYLLLCVRRRAEPLLTAAGEFILESPGMGAMRGFDEVSEGVMVDYRPGRKPVVTGIDDPVVVQNLKDITSLRAEHVYAGMFSTPQRPNIYYEYPEMTDVTPVWYNGRFTSNTFLHHITPLSYLTASANPNSRYYMFGDMRGYGSTCINFALSMFGLTETYSMTQLWREPLLKFERSSFNAQADLERLSPCDLLLEINTETRGGHIMMVKELIHDADGALFGVTIVEAWPPFSRQRTFYLTDKTQVAGMLKTMLLPEALNTYVCKLRVKPQYVRSLRQTFSFPSEVQVGTVRCDRGTDGLYCMGDPYAWLSVTDETANELFLFCGENYVGTLSLENAFRRNGCRMADFSSMLTMPGLYTVYTDVSAEVQERFYVPEKKAGLRLKRINGDPSKNEEAGICIVAPDYSEIDCIFVYYKREVQEASETPETAPEYLFYVYPAEMVAKADPDKYGEGYGFLTVPDMFEGRRYAYTRVFYRTPYGTYWIGYSNGKLVQSSENTF